MSTTRPITKAYGGYALGLLTVINVVNYMERNAIFALFEPIKRDLVLSDAHLGWLASAYVLVFSLAAFPVGVLSDLSSRTTVTAWGVSFFSAFTSLGGLARNFFQLLVSRAAVGFGGAGANAAGTALVADYFTGTSRAAAMSVFTAGLALGGVLGLLIAGQLEAQYGWRVAFLALGLPGFGLAFLSSRLRDPMKADLLPSVREQVRHLGLETRAVLFAGVPLLTGLGVGAAAAFVLDQYFGADSAVDTAVFALCASAGLALNIRSWVRRAAQGDVGSRVSTGMHSALAELVKGFETVLRTPTLVYVFIGGAFISFGMNGLVGWAPAFMTRELGLTVAEATVLLGKAGLIMGIAGTLAGGFLADWIQKRYTWGRVLISSVGF
ncbi:MAG: MFS transporter [Gemmatimonadales bacterium]|nr:MAG: MFS transporter [Gemmatimonadales bacterium]